MPEISQVDQIGLALVAVAAGVLLALGAYRDRQTFREAREQLREAVTPPAPRRLQLLDAEGCPLGIFRDAPKATDSGRAA